MFIKHSFVYLVNPVHHKQGHLSSFRVDPSSVPLHWPRSASLTPSFPSDSAPTNAVQSQPDSPPREDVPSAGVDDHPGSQPNPNPDNSLVSQHGMTTNAEQPGSPAGPASDDMQIDEDVPQPLSTSQSATSMPTQRPVVELVKRNLRVLPKPNYNELSSGIPPPPSKTSKKGRNNEPKVIAPRSAMRVPRSRSLPFIVGQRYVKSELIDLTLVEVSKNSSLCQLLH